MPSREKEIQSGLQMPFYLFHQSVPIREAYCLAHFVRKQFIQLSYILMSLLFDLRP